MNIYNFLQLTEKLSTSGMPKPEEFKELADSGVQFVINLATPKSENWIPNEYELVKNLGMKYFSVQVNWENPTREDLEDFFVAMDSHSQEKIHVHCQANFRATVFVALYRILRLGWKKEDAFVDVQKIWNPEEFPAWKKFIDDSLKSA